MSLGSKNIYYQPGLLRCCFEQRFPVVVLHTTSSSWEEKKKKESNDFLSAVLLPPPSFFLAVATSIRAAAFRHSSNSPSFFFTCGGSGHGKTWWVVFVGHFWVPTSKLNCFATVQVWRCVQPLAHLSKKNCTPVALFFYLCPWLAAGFLNRVSSCFFSWRKHVRSGKVAGKKYTFGRFYFHFLETTEGFCCSPVQHAKRSSEIATWERPRVLLCVLTLTFKSYHDLEGWRSEVKQSEAATWYAYNGLLRESSTSRASQAWPVVTRCDHRRDQTWPL